MGALGSDPGSIDGVQMESGDRIVVKGKPHWWQFRKRRAVRNLGVWVVSSYVGDHQWGRPGR